MYPKSLIPTSKEIIRLNSGEEIEIPTAKVGFEKWIGERIEDTYGGKVILNYDGEPVFAELAILRAFQKDGWNGVWVDTYGRKYRIEYWNDKNGIGLPLDKQSILNTIYENLGSKKGCWDVFCWKEYEIFFAESKRFSKDRIRETQVKFLEAALAYGLRKKSFLIVEWTLT